MYTFIFLVYLSIYPTTIHPSICPPPIYPSIHPSLFSFIQLLSAKPCGFTDEKHYLCLSLILERQTLNNELANLVLDENCDQYYSVETDSTVTAYSRGFWSYLGAGKAFLETLALKNTYKPII